MKVSMLLDVELSVVVIMEVRPLTVVGVSCLAATGAPTP